MYNYCMYQFNHLVANFVNKLTYLQHPGRIFTEQDVGEIFSAAYSQAATVGNGCEWIQQIRHTSV